MVKLPLAELLSLRAESAAAEQEVFDRLKEQAAAWEEQAGRTLFLDKALEYARRFPLPIPQTSGRPRTSTAISAATWSTRWITPFPRIPGMTAPPKKKSIPYCGRPLGPLYQRAPRKPAGKDRRTGSESLCQPGRTGQVPEWPDQSPRTLLFTEISPAIPRNTPTALRSTAACSPATPLREKPAKAAELPAQEETAAAAADHNHPRKGGNP